MTAPQGNSGRPGGRALKVLILGAGYRGRAYAEYAKEHPDRMEIAGVADPVVPVGTIPAPRHWKDWRDCLDDRPEADVVFVTMPDALHHEPAIRALELGYHLLLEKPISPTERECREVIDCALRNRRLVIIGHVLRYTAYFGHIKALIDSGELGEIVSIAHQESAGFWKVAHSYVRGNWANSKKASPLILAKCSHDFDLFVWWIGRKCRKVSSFGSIRLFRKENCPKGAAKRCVDCPPAIERACVWSARNLYVDHDELKYLFADPSDEAMRRLIAETEYGTCVYQAENDVPDHQAVTMEFEGGVTVSHVMTGFTAKNIRTTRIALTRGEIIGDGENLDVCRFDGNPVETGVPMNFRIPNRSRHGGGDFNLLDAMIRILKRNDPDEIRRTTEEALQSHLISFAAERSRLAGGQVVELT